MISGEQRGPVTVLTLDHGKANAVDTELCHGLVAALDEMLREGAPAVVLTGTGRIFSAGVDLFQVLEGGEEYLEEFLPALDAMLRAVVEFPRPLVAAVNGHAVAGGCVLVCACDRRLMAGADAAAEGKGGKAGRIGVPELAVGVPFPTMPLEVLRTAVSSATFRDLVYSGRTVKPEEALELGLVDRVVDPGDLLDEACAEAERLSDLPDDAFALTKRQFWTPALDAMDRHGPAWSAEVLTQWSSEATQERIRRYLEKTVGKKG